MAVEQPLVHGFMINGYRSFHGEPQKIFPLGKTNLIAGSNNSGKSNVLLAAQQWLTTVRNGGEPITAIGILDLPQMRDEAASSPQLTFGICIEMSSDALTHHLVSRSNSPSIDIAARRNICKSQSHTNWDRDPTLSRMAAPAP